MSSIRILLGDDHALMRCGLRKILEERPEMSVVAEVGDGRQAVEQALALRPDVVVLDIGMPLLNGIEATRQIVRRDERIRILILSMHAEEAYVTQAVLAGARGYLLKDSAGADLLSAVSALVAGKAFFSPPVARVLADEYVRKQTSQGRVADRHDTLSEREREVLQLAAEGHTNKDIAKVMSVSPTTVETHRANLMRKLDLHSTADLVLYAVRRGVIT